MITFELRYADFLCGLLKWNSSLKEISAQMLGFEPKYWISGDSQLMDLNTTIFQSAARTVVMC